MELSISNMGRSNAPRSEINMATGFTVINYKDVDEEEKADDYATKLDKDVTQFMDSLRRLDFSERAGECVVARMRDGQDLLGEIVFHDSAYWLKPDTEDPDGGYFPRHLENDGREIQLGDSNGMVVKDAIKKIHTLAAMSCDSRGKEFYTDVLWAFGDFIDAGAYDLDGNWLTDNALIAMANVWDHRTDGKKERILKSTDDPEAELVKVKADIKRREHERNVKKLEKKMERRAAREAMLNDGN